MATKQADDNIVNQQKKIKQSNIPIDRGYAWFIVLGLFIFNTFGLGALIRSVGIIVVEYVEEFGVGAATASWIASMIFCISAITAPFANSLARRFGARPVVMMGGLIAGLGIISTSQAQNIQHVIICYGGIGGFGLGLGLSPGLVILGEYFHLKRSLATGIAMSGSSVGALIMPPFIRFLLDKYTTRGATIILGAIVFHMCLSGALFRPLSSFRPCSNNKQEMEQMLKDESDEAVVNSSSRDKKGDCNLSPRKNHPNLKLCLIDDNNDRTNIQPETSIAGECKNLDITNQNELVPKTLDSFGKDANVNQTKEHPITNARSNKYLYMNSTWSFHKLIAWFKERFPVELSLLRNRVFLTFEVSNFLGNFGQVSVLVFIPAFADDLGIPRTQTAVLVSIMGGADLFCRIVFGFIADHPKIERIYLVAAGYFILGVCLLCAPFIRGFVPMAIYVAVIGAGFSPWQTLRNVVMIDLYGIHIYSYALGMTILNSAIPLLVAAPLLGWLRDITGTFYWPYRVCGIAWLCVTFLHVFAIPIAQKWQKRKENTKQHRTDSLA
ncbi:unnamed protein product [Owenia fusiformis]|uniref:Uncharacterized protein n=1 Tax=Owenia fusiformis TaxID=6347 RepID=A0A8J1U665_OWEFU|nr:unnamed protein product [Owenia fusiformis]